MIGSQMGGHGDDVFHFVEYSTGAFLAYIAIVRSRHVKGSRLRYILAFALSLAIAGVDELLQGFIPGRLASATDVGVDFLGVVSSLSMIGGGSWLYRKRRGSKTTL